MTVDWPVEVHPTEVAVWFEPVTATSVSPLTRQMLAAERDGARWAAEVTVELSGWLAARFAAWLAACRGAVMVIRVPLWLHDGATGSLRAMDDYAAEVGVTRFSDGSDFDDGTGFLEGAGQPHVTGGVGAHLAVAGCAPWTRGVLNAGDAVAMSPGSVHLIVHAGGTDIDGRMIVSVRPRIRTPAGRTVLVTDGLLIHMRLAGSDIGRGVTQAPCRTRWTLSLEEALS